MAERAFQKMNRRPLKIYFSETGDGKSYFRYKGSCFYLDDIVRTHDNPWTGDMHLPDYIHGFDTSHSYALFVELLPDGESVNVYEEKE